MIQDLLDKRTMTTKLGREVIHIASTLCMSSHRLMPVRIHSLKKSALKECSTIPSEGYNNAITSALRIGAGSVVFGAIMSPAFDGTIIEHAWVKLRTGQYIDPTYQRKEQDQYSMIDFTYYALVEIRVENYMQLLKELNVRCRIVNASAIDFMHLRGSGKYNELFTHRPLPLPKRSNCRATYRTI